MEEKKRINWQIIIPIIIAVILVVVFLYLDYRDRPKEEIIEQIPESKITKPLSPSENPGRKEQLNPGLGCAGPSNIEPIILKQSDTDWLISKDGEITTISLGKYKINAPANLVFDIPRLWLYFFSNKLSNREDSLYGLEKSYTSRIFLMINGYERQLNLGGSDYMFVELDDYPLGDLYPYNRETALEFEFLIELKCENLEKRNCFDNQGKVLDYIDNADIRAQIRIFAVGCQEFTNDVVIDANFQYGD
jgi:hypothetical protein